MSCHMSMCWNLVPWVLCSISTNCCCSLHGIWDGKNPIGQHIYGHTNLTEMKSAFDLFWRNDVPANKLNMGLGFYGRSFQLEDDACSKPGCNFKGGAIRVAAAGSRASSATVRLQTSSETKSYTRCTTRRLASIISPGTPISRFRMTMPTHSHKRKTWPKTLGLVDI